MAYQPRPAFENLSPVIEHEHRSPWTRHEHAPYAEATVARTPDVMEPENEDSDNSTDGDIGWTPFPINLPSAPSKQVLDTQEAILAHLEEMELVENHNIQKQKHLKDKRARMDDKIMRKRAAQDAKIKAIIDARTRRDSNIKMRRDREDIAFQQFFDVLEEEETRLRKRLKALKRGLPADELVPESRRVSVNSMSPIGPSYSTKPPPAKRHQASHPAQAEPRHTQRPPDQTSFLPPSEHPAHPSYSFAQSPGPPTAYQSHGPPPFQPPPQPQPQTHPQSPIPASHPRPMSGSGDYPPQVHSGPGASPSISEPSARSAPPRHPASSYDTRPPPPSFGFAAVNHPQPSGFAAVNSGYAVTPPAPPHSIAKEHGHKSHAKSADHTPSRNNGSEEKNGGNSNKRTPSTTHPYQMSEAFANRHHHCEDTDSLNRGIWTWYGFGGTQDRPTAQPTRMYLKCNHDGCGRIDWRTVHGLQCHIVKNHEQPRGTIGSLEKALTAYGVPVKDIEDFENEHGLGSGGTMADPKNLKMKSKHRDLSSRGSPAAASSVIQNHRQSQDPIAPSPLSGSHRVEIGGRNDRSIRPDAPGSAKSPIDVDQHYQPRPAGFAAVNTVRPPVHATPSRRPTSSDHERHPSMGSAHGPVNGSAPSTQPSNGPISSYLPTWKEPNQSVGSQPEPNIASAAVLPLHEGSARRTIEDINRETLIRSREQHPESTMLSKADEADSFASKEAQNEVQTAPQDGSNDTEMKDAYDVRDSQHDAIMKDAVARPVDKSSERPSEITHKKVDAGSSGETAKDQPTNADNESRDRVEHGPNGATADDEKPTKAALNSLDVSNKRVQPSRRESRRASVATNSSNKAITDKAKDEEMETVSADNTTPKPASVADDENDSIIVNIEAIKAEQREKEREKDDERSKPATPARRAPNGRFSKRQRG